MNLFIIFIVLLLSGGVLWSLLSFHSVRQQQNMLTQVWQWVNETLISRNEILSNLQDIAKASGVVAGSEVDPLRDLIAQDTSLDSEAVTDRTAIQNAIRQQAHHLVVRLEQVPTIAGHPDYQAAKQALIATEQVLVKAVQQYNRSVQLYNALLLKQPNAWLAEKWHYVPAPYSKMG